MLPCQRRRAAYRKLLAGSQGMLGGDPGGTDVSPYAAATQAEQLAGSPPTSFCASAPDLFQGEGVSCARRLIYAEIPAEIHIYPVAYHAFALILNARELCACDRDLPDGYDARS